MNHPKTDMEIPPQISPPALTHHQTIPPQAKPLVVRVKRKRLHAPLESLWLEVIERPAKRLEVDFASVSLDDSAGQSSRIGAVGELTTMKMLFRHLETVSSFGAEEASRVDSFLKKAGDGKSMQKRWKEWRKTVTTSKAKQDLLLTRAREMHQSVSRTARFEQVWRKRKGSEKEPEDDIMHELFRLYDVVRVDNEEEDEEKSFRRQQAKREAQVAEDQLLCNYLPLLREYLPEAVSEIESNTSLKRDDQDEYVYDVYALQEGADEPEADKMGYPTVQVRNDGEFYWGESAESECDTEDSNDENNPVNDYPEDDSELESESDVEKGETDEEENDDLEVEDQSRNDLSDVFADDFGIGSDDDKSDW